MNRVYNILTGFLIAGMLLHLAFSPLNIIKDQKLHGYYKEPEGLAFSIPAYFNREFQDSTDKYINYQFGLFPAFTRINHQVEYSLFGNVKVQNVHKGKNGYLMRYCSGCVSTRTFEPNSFNTFLDRYGKLRDSLQAAGKNIIWLIAPDKNLVFPEYLPDDIRAQAQPGVGFYWDLKKAFEERKMEMIDFNQLAYNERTKYPFEVINKGGVHWTQGYAARCFDSLCNYLSATTTFSLRNTITIKPEVDPWLPDIDIEKSANLLFPLDRGKFYACDVIPVVTAKQKKALFIGDSFGHVWLWKHWLMQSFNEESEFWYYNREAHNSQDDFLRTLDHKNVRKAIEKFDVIIFLYTAANAEYLDYGFINDVYQ